MALNALYKLHTHGANDLDVTMRRYATNQRSDSVVNDGINTNNSICPCYFPDRQEMVTPILFVCSKIDLSGVQYRGQSIIFIYVVDRSSVWYQQQFYYWIDFGDAAASARQKLANELRPLTTVIAVGLDCLSSSQRSVFDEINDRRNDSHDLIGGTVSHRFVKNGTYRVSSLYVQPFLGLNFAI